MKNNNSTTFIIVSGIFILCVFAFVVAYNILPNNKESNSYYVKVGDDMSAKIATVEIRDGKLYITPKAWKNVMASGGYTLKKTDGDVLEMEWHPYRYMSNHVNRYKLGNCYRTKEEAEANRDKWVKFYKSDEVLEV